MTRRAFTALACAALLATTAARAAGPATAPFLWQVQGPLATHYLLGSMHLLPARDDSLPDALEDAYAAADGAVFETDIGALASRSVQLQLLAAAHRDRPLRSRLEAALYRRLQARARSVGMPMTLCDGYAAWFCAINLELYSDRHDGFSEEYGIDQHFYGEAVNDGKTVQWLESPAAHLAVFTGMSTALSRTLLRSALDDGDVGAPRTLYRAWRADDTAAVATIDARLKSRYPALYARFITVRNHTWLPQLRELLDGGDAQLIVVGAAHLVGPDGLVASLRAMGYRVRRGLPPAPSGERSAALAGPRFVSLTVADGKMHRHAPPLRRSLPVVCGPARLGVAGC